MRHKIIIGVTTVVAGGMVAGGLTAQAQADTRAAAPPVVIGNLSHTPNPVVIKGRATVKIKFSVPITTDDPDSAQVRILHGSDTPFNYPLAKNGANFTGTGELNWVNTPGKYTLQVWALNSDATLYTKNFTTTLYRGTKFSLAADPVKPKKGKKFTLKGVLKGINGVGQYAPYKKGQVHFLFRAAGTTKWKAVGKTSTTNKKGGFAQTFTAKKAGTWMVTFGTKGAWYGSSKTLWVGVK